MGRRIAEPPTPIDDEIRAWLKAHVSNQRELSLSIGRSGSWLHKYVNGDGQATIDDLVRIAGLLFGLNLPVLSEAEREAVQTLRELSADRQADALAVLKIAAQGYRREPRQESNERAGHTPAETGRRARGKP